MAKTDLSVKIGAEFVGKAAFQKAEKSITKLGKQTAALITGGGLLAFGRSTVQAFYESEKSAKALYGTLNNLGLAFRKDDVNKYVDALSRATGIVDEVLNPAMAQLLLNTRSVEKSQKILATALDISATTGDSLQSVVDALGKAYSGNTTALGKLNLGITKTQLSANKFDDILKYLAVTFDGQASAAASGFTGNVDKLKVSIDQLKESIGKGLVEGINADGNIDKTTNSLSNLSEVLGKVAYAVGFLSTVGKTNLFSKEFWRGLVGDPTANRVTGMGDGSDRGGASKVAEAKLAAQQKAAAAAQLKATKALTKAQQDQAKIKKSQGILDIEQANILAALQGKITSNEKLRLELQLALLTGNSKEADRLSNELLLSQARLTGLATFISNLPKALNPFADYPFYVQQALAELAKVQNTLAVSPNKYDQIQSKLTAQNIAMGIDAGAAAGLAASSARLQAEADAYFKNNPNIDPMSGAVINVKVEVGGQQLTDIVTTQQLNNSASGSQSRINRLALMD